MNVVPQHLFRGLEKLKSLHLTLKQPRIEANMFQYLLLKKVNLHVANATGLPGSLFTNSKNALLEVTIDGERLTSLPEYLFREQDLRKVYLNFPNCHSLPRDLFQVGLGGIVKTTSNGISFFLPKIAMMVSVFRMVYLLFHCDRNLRKLWLI